MAPPRKKRRARASSSSSSLVGVNKESCRNQKLDLKNPLKGQLHYAVCHEEVDVLDPSTGLLNKSPCLRLFHNKKLLSQHKQIHYKNTFKRVCQLCPDPTPFTSIWARTMQIHFKAKHGIVDSEVIKENVKKWSSRENRATPHFTVKEYLTTLVKQENDEQSPQLEEGTDDKSKITLIGPDDQSTAIHESTAGEHPISNRDGFNNMEDIIMEVDNSENDVQSDSTLSLDSNETSFEEGPYQQDQTQAPLSSFASVAVTFKNYVQAFLCRTSLDGTVPEVLNSNSQFMSEEREKSFKQLVQDLCERMMNLDLRKPSGGYAKPAILDGQNIARNYMAVINGDTEEELRSKPLSFKGLVLAVEHLSKIGIENEHLRFPSIRIVLPINHTLSNGDWIKDPYFRQLQDPFGDGDMKKSLFKFSAAVVGDPIMNKFIYDEEVELVCRACNGFVVSCEDYNDLMDKDGQMGQCASLIEKKIPFFFEKDRVTDEVNFFIGTTKYEDFPGEEVLQSIKYS